MITKLPGIRSIKLNGNQFSDKCLEAISTSCRRISSISILSCKFITNYGIENLIGQCKVLKQLTIIECRNISKARIEDLIKKTAISLEWRDYVQP